MPRSGKYLDDLGLERVWSKINSLLESAVSALEILIGNKQDQLTWDDTPTEDSENPVTSDGIYNKVQELESNLEEFSEAVRQEFDNIQSSNVNVVGLTANEVESIWNSVS